MLQKQYNHRVRLATHPVFKDFVESNGLEFFSIGGDPAELMAFMVKNPGLMPGFDSLRRGDIGNRRREIAKMVDGCWRSCIEPGNRTVPDNYEAANDQSSASNGSSSVKKLTPFVANAIIANPPSFAHIHCAEKLAIPLHMMFTMPWSPTQAFPHPLANIQKSSEDPNITNFVSYAIVEMMTWQGLGDLINDFREKTLGLESIPITGAPGMLARLKIPWTYCWSPALIPKPRDWGPLISISGFYFLSLASSYTPTPELSAFLDSGPPPVYIGFGSIVLDDPNGMTKLIFDAVKKSGQRALVSKGWGGFGNDELDVPDNIFMLGNCPHDWLFKRVSCVVHHGGAGTTAAGIACGRPTVVVPFFGDQPFWGAMVARAGAGPPPIPKKELTSDRLSDAINQALKPDSLTKAKLLSESIANESGAETGAANFQANLDQDSLRCLICSQRPAVWRIKRTNFRLSAFAAAVLIDAQFIKKDDLKLYRPVEHRTEGQPSDPITGGASALLNTLTSMAMGTADMNIKALKALKIHPDAVRQRPESPASSSVPSSETVVSEEHKDAKGAGESTAEDEQSSARSRPPSVRLEPDALAKFRSPPSESPAGESSPGAYAGKDDDRELTVETLRQDVANARAATADNDDGGPRRSGSSKSRSPSRKSSSRGRKPEPGQAMDLETAVGLGKGFYKMSNVGIKSPMEFTLGLARGFHNAPRLYNDETVRPVEKVTSLSSGIKVAANEVRYGLSDGITGLVKHPMSGAKKEGAAGFFKGIGKGVGGLILKPGAAFWGIPAYTSQGLYKELQSKLWPNSENYIAASRTTQGYEEVRTSTTEEREAVISRWKELRWYIKKKKNFQEEQAAKREGIKYRFSPSHSPAPERDLFEPNSLERVGTNWSVGTGVYSPPEKAFDDGILGGEENIPALRVDSFDEDNEPDRELEEAIKKSVAETSQGDSEQDAAVEQAIRASLHDLEMKRATGADDRELQQAMEHSLADAQRGRTLERESSQTTLVPEQHDKDLETALAESKSHHEEMEQAKTEEDIVMRHIMKQSLLEEEMKKKHAEAGDAG